MRNLWFLHFDFFQKSVPIFAAVFDIRVDAHPTTVISRKETDRTMKRPTAPDAPMADEAIVDLYFARDEQAIAETDRKYGAYLLRLGENILHNTSDSEECRNEVYLKLWNRIPPDRPHTLPAYLNRIMRATAIDRYRARARQGGDAYAASLDELAEILPAPDTVESAWESAELARQISHYLRGESRRRQYLFVARYFRAEPVEAIAHELGVSPSAVYKELTRLRRGLQTHLERNGFFL